MQFFHILNENASLKVLLLCVLLDTIFGILRAIKERKVNSNVGIDGLIRKCGMIVSVIVFILIDIIMTINLVGFIPKEILDVLKIETIGISTLFTWLFILYESLSILKNMIRCKLPIPKKLQEALEKLFKSFTNELEEGNEKEDGKKQ